MVVSIFISDHMILFLPCIRGLERGYGEGVISRRQRNSSKYIDLLSEELCSGYVRKCLTICIQTGCAPKYNAKNQSDHAGMDALQWPGVVSLKPGISHQWSTAKREGYLKYKYMITQTHIKNKFNTNTHFIEFFII